MPKSPDEIKRDEVLLRMLKTPPTPHVPLKGKPKASPKAAKARTKRHQGR